MGLVSGQTPTGESQARPHPPLGEHLALDPTGQGPCTHQRPARLSPQRYTAPCDARDGWDGLGTPGLTRCLTPDGPKGPDPYGTPEGFSWEESSRCPPSSEERGGTHSLGLAGEFGYDGT